MVIYQESLHDARSTKCKILLLLCTLHYTTQWYHWYYAKTHYISVDFSALLSLVWATADWLSEVTLKLCRPIPSNNTKQSVCISNSVHTYWSLFAALHWCRLCMSIWAGLIMGYRSNGNCTLHMSLFFFMDTKCQLFTKRQNKISKAVKKHNFWWDAITREDEHFWQKHKISV